MAPSESSSGFEHVANADATPSTTATTAASLRPRHTVANAFVAPTDSGNPVGDTDPESDVAADDEFQYPPLSTPYRILNQYHSKPTKLRIAGVGAGASGLCLIYKVKKDLVPGSWELTVYEKNAAVGGTWLENAYPGVACDTPSCLYTFSWDQKHDWSHYYAYGPEIRQYFEDFATKNNCMEHIQFSTRLVEARFDGEQGHWSIIVENQITGERHNDWCHVLVNASGILNNWKWPDIPGLDDFAGTKMHSARWDNSVDLKGKTVGLIGNGSTGVQLVPALQKEVSHMSVFMRSPTWIAPPFGASALEQDIRQGKQIERGKGQHTFTDEQKQRFKDDPEYYLWFRKRLEAEFNSIYQNFIQGTSLGKAVRAAVTREMVARIGDGPDAARLREQLLPTWSPGCRRLSPGDGFLEALIAPNVSAVFNGIRRVTANGLETEDGTQHNFDVLVCATGFNPAFRPAFPIYNGVGKSLDEDWGKHVNLYLGMSAPRFPNLYTIAGPGSTWAAGSLLPSIEVGVEYAVKMMKKIQEENIRTIEVRQDALDDLFEHFDTFHSKTIWQENCRSWYKDGKIKNRIYLWPGGTIHHVKTLKNPRFEDYRIKYRYRNRFAYLGNGEVKANMSGDVDGLSSYIRTSDHSWDIE